MKTTSNFHCIIDFSSKSVGWLIIKCINNKRPKNHIAHISNNSKYKISFLESYTKYHENVVEKILYKRFSKIKNRYCNINDNIGSNDKNNQIFLCQKLSTVCDRRILLKSYQILNVAVLRKI